MSRVSGAAKVKDNPGDRTDPRPRRHGFSDSLEATYRLTSLRPLGFAGGGPVRSLQVAFRSRHAVVGLWRRWRPSNL
jgi:hypothetical protein